MICNDEQRRQARAAAAVVAARRGFTLGEVLSGRHPPWPVHPIAREIQALRWTVSRLAAPLALAKAAGRAPTWDEIGQRYQEAEALLGVVLQDPKERPRILAACLRQAEADLADEAGAIREVADMLASHPRLTESEVALAAGLARGAWKAVRAARLARQAGRSAPTTARLAESAGAADWGAVVPPSGGNGGIVRGVTLLKAGASLNRRYYPRSVLERDGAKVFENAPVFAVNHDRVQKDVRTLVGVLKAVRMDGDRLRGDLHAGPAGWPTIEHALWHSRELGPDAVGLSIDTQGRFRQGSAIPNEVAELLRTALTSVDLVLHPAAGGSLVA